MAHWYWYDEDGKQQISAVHPANSRPILAAIEWMQPALIGELHQSMARWTETSTSPGDLIPERLWIDPQGRLAVRFAAGEPAPRSAVGTGRELAQWFVLLDKWMETYVVLARARSVWTVAQLAAALSFTTPSLLPQALVTMPPTNWERVARGLAAIVVDGPLADAKE